MEKPFMLIPDDKENLASLIAETGIGIAASTTEDIKRFTLSQYAQWENQGFTRLSIDDKERFSRRYQAQLFDALMTSLIA